MYSETSRVTCVNFCRLESSVSPSAHSLALRLRKCVVVGVGGGWGGWQGTRILIEGMISLAKTGREAGKGGGLGGWGIYGRICFAKAVLDGKTPLC